MAFALPALPYGYDALEPFMSEATVRMHHDGNQARYVEKTNALLAKAPRYRGATLRQLVELAGRARSSTRGSNQAFFHELFDQASQTWNHAFFWHCMRPGGGGRPPPNMRHLPALIRAAAGKVFGSGWVWVYVRGARGELGVVSTPNAEQPPGAPVLVCDLWEHAFLLDYPVARAKYVDAWLDNLVDWNFAQQVLHGQIPGYLR